MAKFVPQNVARKTGSIGPAEAAARKAARLEKEAKNAADLESVKSEIRGDFAAENPFYKNALISIFNTVSKNQANGKSREIQLIDAGYVYHSTISAKYSPKEEIAKLRGKYASFGLVKNVNGIHLYVLPLKGEK